MVRELYRRRARIRSSEAASIARVKAASPGPGCHAAADLPPGHGPGTTAQAAALLLPLLSAMLPGPGCAPLPICRPDPSGVFRRARSRQPRRPGIFSRLHKKRRADGQKPGRIFAAKGFMRAVLYPVAFLNTPPYNPPVVQFDGGRCTRRAGSAPPRAQPSPRAQPWPMARAVWYHAYARAGSFRTRFTTQKKLFTPRRGVTGHPENFLQKGLDSSVCPVLYWPR